MKTDNTLAAKGGEARETRAEKALRLLETTIADPFNQRLEEFQAFYPAVVTAKRNGMKNKQIIKILAEGGLKLYPALFEKLMAAMRTETDTSTCPTCGQGITVPKGSDERINTATAEGPSLAETGMEDA